ncbi:MAG: hypothetical protein ACOCYE_07605 [Pseudomonadota bacterium]
MSDDWPSLLRAGAVNVAIIALMNAFALVVALVILAALPGLVARSLALLAFALVYGWATWRALQRVREDKGWPPFRAQLVFACGHFLTVMLVLEIVLAWM